MRLNLIVLYTERVGECRDFYRELGLELVDEQHGTGPVHYAAELSHGTVLEIYPGTADRATGRLRLGLTVPGLTAPRTVVDPDGRAVALSPPGTD